MTKEEVNQLQNEAFEHLWQGRYRMALSRAQDAFDAEPNDSENAICLAWAYLENGVPSKALEYANLAVELKGNSAKARLYRGYLLMRMSIFEGALSDIDTAEEQFLRYFNWTYINKARTLAGMGKFNEAIVQLEKAININPNDALVEIKLLYKSAGDVAEGNSEINNFNVEDYIKKCYEAMEIKEYWYSLFVSRKIISNSSIKKLKDDAELIELESMYYMYQFRPVFKKMDEMFEKYRDNLRFQKIFNMLKGFTSQEKPKDKPKKSENTPKENNEIIEPFAPTPTDIKSLMEKSIIPKGLKTHPAFFPNDKMKVFSCKVFDVKEEKMTGKRSYYLQFNATGLSVVGVEVIFENPFFSEKDVAHYCKAVWYVEDVERKVSNFSITCKKEWDSIIFIQTAGENENIWFNGQGRVEIYVEHFKVCEKWFVIGNGSYPEMDKKPDLHSSTTNPGVPGSDKNGSISDSKVFNDVNEKVVNRDKSKRSLEELLLELDKYIGLGSIKKSVRDFIAYLEFQQERKNMGLKSEDSISVNAIFKGNPGTGKTTIARLIGEIFKAMGILNRGHVVEVDRSALVGQYIGETAQKADKIITDAMGGVLFIDEAYTLVKKSGSAQDFGQEAVDILLKRMEDHKGKFAVIAAGYPEEMNTFLESNPGLKSRFNHVFEFEDYTPDELFAILKLSADNQEFNITPEAEKLIKKHFTNLYRKRDKSFGNARLVKKFFEDAKMEVGRRYTELTSEERNKEALVTINEEDVKKITGKIAGNYVQIPIDEETLNDALNELDNLIGINSVREEMRDTVKLAKYYLSQGENLQDKFGSHIVFLGNPGTGKTTVARIVGKIYAALGILPKGHLIETDRQGLVSSNVGGTAEKTTEKINEAIGGTLFIDEAYALVKNESSNDFGKEAIDTLLKRMEDDRGKFIVIAAGYTDEMNKFLESNPGLKSRFTKTFIFEDYTPEELMQITKRQLLTKEAELSESAEEELLKYYTTEYRSRDKNFGNARIVRNIVDEAYKRKLIKLADLDDKELSKINEKQLTADEIKLATGLEKRSKKYEIKVDEKKLQKNLEQLNSLTGLNAVKEEVDKLIKSLKVTKLRKERGLNIVDKGLHAVFLGNPGTGKTSVARILSTIYRDLGLLEKGHIVEVDRADLVAGYQGQTAIKTNNLIQKAIGGTLFIDEAYTLARGPNDFGQEAIDTLLKKMEDRNGEFVVIVAGYPEEMKYFLESNPGLNSRFHNLFNFDDYTPRQLLEIAANISESNGYKLDEGAIQLMWEIFQKIYNKRDKNFGNARTAKKILFKAISYQEERISQMMHASDEDLMTIKYEDFLKISPEHF